jgi:hypothetical protein
MPTEKAMVNVTKSGFMVEWAAVRVARSLAGKFRCAPSVHARNGGNCASSN